MRIVGSWSRPGLYQPLFVELRSNYTGRLRAPFCLLLINDHDRESSMLFPLIKLITIIGNREDNRRIFPLTSNIYWRMGCSGSTSSTNNAVLSTMHRAPQLRQKTRHLQLNVTRCSALHDSRSTRRSQQNYIRKELTTIMAILLYFNSINLD